jgi:lysophospholipase L1-like esterase
MFLIEACAVGALLAVYKSSGRSMPEIARSLPGFGLFVACVLMALAIGLLRSDRRSCRNPRLFWYTFLLNVFSVLVIVVLAETGLRVGEKVDPEFDEWFPRGFLPRDWDKVASANRDLLIRAKTGQVWAGSFLVHDRALGWTVGESRSSANGLYCSSAEGIRSPSNDQSYSDTAGAKRRVAMIGNSYTFGLGVAFEDTWGSRLQERLGDRYQVLNFGVVGYGLDQVYLRYLEHVRSWKPEIAILGLISHDLQRTEVVYPFLSFPSWRFPFSKPRFVMAGGGLKIVNVPLPDPEELFTARSIQHLPSIALEPSYFPEEWESEWYSDLYTIRLLVSLFPRWPQRSPEAWQSRLDLNAAILRSLVEKTTMDGTVLAAVFFPSHGAGELSATDNPTVRDASPVHRLFADAQVDYLDLTTCLMRLPAGDRIAPDGIHYSPSANRAVAECLEDYLTGLGVIERSVVPARSSTRTEKVRRGMTGEVPGVPLSVSPVPGLE